MLASRRPLHILLVKTSSLGDLIHNLPVVSDLTRCFPGCVIDWVAEESFADVPALHPGVRKVHCVALRRWRKKLFATATWNEIRAFNKGLRQESYDLVIDTQGLIKSACLARMAIGTRAGFDRASAREGLATFFYDQGFAVPRGQHAVARNRQLAAAVLGYPLAELPLDYGLRPPPFAAGWLAGDRRYLVLLTASSRDDKLWPEADWIALGRHLVASDFRLILPAGGAQERARAERLALAINAQKSPAIALAAPALPIRELAALLAGAVGAVGVDTGLTHLAAAVGIPTVALYTATDPGLTGVLASSFHRNLGGVGHLPVAGDVLAALAAAGIGA